MKTIERYSDLVDLYMIPTYKSSKVIKEKIKQLIPDYDWTEDEKGNMYGSHKDSTSGVVLSAHLDMVKTGKDIANVVNVNSILFGVDKDWKLTSLGADDKNGIWCIVQASKHKSKPHIVLFEEEETGRVGSLNCNRDWFNDKDCCIVIDRKGNREIIIQGFRGQYTSMLGACFQSVNPHWKFETGMGCDADSIKDIIDCINISCGYYEAHTADEYTNLIELEETLKAINNFLDHDWSALPWENIKNQHLFLYGNKQNKCNGNQTEETEELIFDWPLM